MVELFNMYQLWAMPPDVFNEWRTQNDLPLLFDYLQKKLPRFEEWMKDQNLSLEQLIRVVPTGDVFRIGLSEHNLIVEYRMKTDGKQYCKVVNQRLNEYISQISKNNTIERISESEFTPYFKWVSKFDDRYISIEKNGIGRSDTFVYNSWAAPMGKSELSRASLFQEFEVLKLGGIQLPHNTIIGGRNLDFTDLDFLELKGNPLMGYGSSATSVSYSSCRELKIINVDLHHFDFYQCNVEDFTCFGSRLQGFRFISSFLGNLTIDDTKLYGLSLEMCNIFEINFNKCDINKFLFVPSTRNADISRIFDHYRSIRVAFQNIGKRDEASKYYYLERCFERKLLKNPYLAYRELFPVSKYNGRLGEIIQHFRTGLFSKKDSLKFVLYIFLHHLKIWTTPRYFYRAIKFKAKYLFSLFDFLIWGYGEKPGRILLSSLVVLSIYSTVYYLSGNVKIASVVDAIYFSVVTFTTLGYGDITPDTAALKMTSSSEALLGALFIGLLVAGFSNRSKY